MHSYDEQSSKMKEYNEQNKIKKIDREGKRK